MVIFRDQGHGPMVQERALRVSMALVLVCAALAIRCFRGTFPKYLI